MSKRRPALHPDQLDLAFGVPEAASSDGALADLPRVIASAVAVILKDDPRSRFEIAGEISRLMDEDVSKLMLDAYASEARDGHRISFDRFLALVAATGRYDVLRSVMRRIGVGLLVGEEVFLAEIGHLQAEIRDREQRLRMLRAEAKPMNRGERRK
jgi:hypothetical protein